MNIDNFLKATQSQSSKTRVLLFLLLKGHEMNLVRSMKRVQLNDITFPDEILEHVDFISQSGGPNEYAFSTSKKAMPPYRIREIIKNATKKAGVKDMDELRKFVFSGELA